MVVLIDGDSADIADHPVVRQRLRPRRIEHKARRGSFVLGRHRLREPIQNVGLLQSVRGARRPTAGRRQMERGDSNNAPARITAKRPYLIIFEIIVIPP